ncbi:hypothetical protein [Komagataeibacter xylinus]|uniref:hypothetical protein n=1 Tax=Komagataeibacter xylinus TaxID=28448 RepID=UPI0013EE5C82|nr:hypothetical protein [Komagataeibacter xylinus]
MPFGYGDARFTHAQLRARWIAQGCPWHSTIIAPPARQDARRQMVRTGLIGAA